MQTDFWYGDNMSDVIGASCTFYPNEGIYRGWLFNEAGKIIGDYTSSDSVEIENTFPGIFGE